MKYAKLINNYPQYAPNPILHDGLWYGNPPGSIYEADGYKPVRHTDAPEVETGFVAVPGWTETEDEIVQTWTVEVEPITEEAALVRYANELTGGSAETLEDATETLLKIAKEGK